MTPDEMRAELTKLETEWDAFRADDDDMAGHGGSPGEWMVERMGELEQALRACAAEKKEKKK